MLVHTGDETKVHKCDLCEYKYVMHSHSDITDLISYIACIFNYEIANKQLNTTNELVQGAIFPTLKYMFVKYFQKCFEEINILL